jgi:hypothetical protein
MKLKKVFFVMFAGLFLFSFTDLTAQTPEEPITYVNVIVKGKRKSKQVGNDYEVRCKGNKKICVIFQVPEIPDEERNTIVTIYNEDGETVDETVEMSSLEDPSITPEIVLGEIEHLVVFTPI